MAGADPRNTWFLMECALGSGESGDFSRSNFYETASAVLFFMQFFCR